MEKLEWLALIDRVKSKEKVERPKVKVLTKGRSKKLDRLSRMEATGGIWGYIDTYYIPPKEEKRVEIKTGNEFWDKVLSEAMNKRRGRPRKQEKGKVLPGSRIGDMYERIGNEYTCNKAYWDDEVREDREVLSGVALEIFEAILYGNDE